MSAIKIIVAGTVMSVIALAPSLAQAGFSEPAAFQAMNPNRDVLNGGALTPAARLGQEQYGGASNAYAAERPDASFGLRRRFHKPASRHVRP